MSARRTARQIAAKAGMLLGALFVFTLLLAALPAHRGLRKKARPRSRPKSITAAWLRWMWATSMRARRLRLGT
jgi:hypothetical protein